MRVLPKHWFRTVVMGYRLVTWIVLAIISLVFAVEHVRHGMYPGLERSEQLGGVQDYPLHNDNRAALSRSMNSSASNR